MLVLIFLLSLSGLYGEYLCSVLLYLIDNGVLGHFIGFVGKH